MVFPELIPFIVIVFVTFYFLSVGNGVSLGATGAFGASGSLQREQS